MNDTLVDDNVEILKDGEDELVSKGRTRQSLLRNGDTHNTRPRKHIEGYNALDEMEDESDASSSEGGWDGGDDDEVDDNIVDDEDEDEADMSDDPVSVAEEDELGAEHDNQPSSLVVALRYQKKKAPPTSTDQLSTTETITSQAPASSNKTRTGFGTAKAAFRPEDSVYVKSDDANDTIALDSANHPFKAQSNPHIQSTTCHSNEVSL